jgi:hypothetical protein
MMVSKLRHLGEASERSVVFTTSVLCLHLVHFLCLTPRKLTITLQTLQIGSVTIDWWYI